MHILTSGFILESNLLFEGFHFRAKSSRKIGITFQRIEIKDGFREPFHLYQ